MIPTNMLIATKFFKRFDPTDRKVPNWDNGTNWLYRPDGDTGVTTRLPFLPFGDQDMGKVKNHAKIMAEAMPALSDAAGFCPFVTAVANTRQFNENTAFKNESVWPTSRPNKTSQQVSPPRWLHGDYKDAAYLYTHGMYDTITELAN